MVEHKRVETPGSTEPLGKLLCTEPWNGMGYADTGRRPTVSQPGNRWRTFYARRDEAVKN